MTFHDSSMIFISRLVWKIILQAIFTNGWNQVHDFLKLHVVWLHCEAQLLTQWMITGMSQAWNSLRTGDTTKHEMRWVDLVHLWGSWSYATWFSCRGGGNGKRSSQNRKAEDGRSTFNAWSGLIQYYETMKSCSLCLNISQFLLHSQDSLSFIWVFLIPKYLN